MTDNITHLGNDIIMQEAQSQADRILDEVAAQLFDMIADEAPKWADFILKNGTECLVRKFYPPKRDDKNELSYGFDVKFDDGPLSHLEFKVTCSGWGRNLNVPKK